MNAKVAVVSVRSDRLLEEQGWAENYTRASLLGEDGRSNGMGEVFVWGEAFEKMVELGAMVEMAPNGVAEIHFGVKLHETRSEAHRAETPWRLSYADQVAGVIVPKRNIGEEFPDEWRKLCTALGRGYDGVQLSDEEQREVRDAAAAPFGFDFVNRHQEMQEEYNRLESRALHAKRRTWLESVAKLIEAMVPGNKMDEEAVRGAVNALLNNGHDGDSDVTGLVETGAAVGAGTSN